MINVYTEQRKFSKNTILGCYTVDCTIPKYIWKIAQMTTMLDESKVVLTLVKLSRHELKYTFNKDTESIELRNRTYETCLWPGAKNARYKHILRHFYIHVYKRRFVKDDFHSVDSVSCYLELIYMYMLYGITCDHKCVENRIG